MIGIGIFNDEVIVSYKSKKIMIFPTSKSVKLSTGIVLI